MKIPLSKPRLIVIACLVVHGFWFRIYYVKTWSMEPTIPQGSLVFARLMRWPEQIHRGDIVVFRPVEGICNQVWIHRAIATGGERVSPPARTGRVDVDQNGRKLPDALSAGAEMTLGPDQLYQSGDSVKSYHGIIGKRNAVGKALWHFALPKLVAP